MRSNGGNVSRTAEALGISRVMLQKKMKKNSVARKGNHFSASRSSSMLPPVMSTLTTS